MIVPFLLAESRAAVVERVWCGRLDLPRLHKMHDWRENVVCERGAGRGFHALTPPLDLEYMKELHDWCRKAKETATTCEQVARGEFPKSWYAKACWLRPTAADMKKAVDARGRKRSNGLDYSRSFKF